MSDLISRQAVRLIESDHDAYPQEWNDDYEKGFADCLEKVLALPSIDAVPVIRCKDCKHWDGRYCHNQWWGDGHVYYTPPIKTEDGYCDWAERKES